MERLAVDRERLPLALNLKMLAPPLIPTRGPELARS